MFSCSYFFIFRTFLNLQKRLSLRHLVKGPPILQIIGKKHFSQQLSSIYMPTLTTAVRRARNSTLRLLYE
jgi:hypothetical protein